MRNPSLEYRTKSLAYSGSFWPQRVSRTQRTLLRTLAAASERQDEPGTVRGLADFALGPGASMPGVWGWTVDARMIAKQGPGRWGVATLALPQSEPVDTPALSSDGLTVVPAGFKTFDQKPVGNLLLGGAPLLFGGAPLLFGAFEAGTYASLAPVFGSRPPHAAVSDTAYSAWFRDGGDPDRRLVLAMPQAGRTATGRASLEFDTRLSEETAWFVKLPPDGVTPDLLFHRQGWLARGSGFFEASGWLVVFENPLELWPNGVVTAVGRNPGPYHVRATALGQAFLGSPGKQLARYRRLDQSLAGFERALWEVAGLSVLETPGVVRLVERLDNRYLHWLEDGRSFELTGATPYAANDRIPAGSGHLLEVRGSLTHGPRWWQGRSWGPLGFDIGAVYPQFQGLMIRDESLEATFDGQDFRIAFGQDPVLEDQFWLWYNAQRPRMSAGLEDFVAFDNGLARVNPLELFAAVLADRLVAVETPLAWTDPRAWKEVLDFAAREKPLGAVVILPLLPVPDLVPDDGHAFVFTTSGGQLAVAEGSFVQVPEEYANT